MGKKIPVWGTTAVRMCLPVLLRLLVCLLPLGASSQIFPKEGSQLNYRIIGFYCSGAGGGTLQIASGNCEDEMSFKKNIILTQPYKDNVTIAETPAFGKEYTWRVERNNVAAGKGNRHLKNGFHHFSTIPYEPGRDTLHTRLRIISDNGTWKNHYVFVDATHTLYDMQGKPVWFVPGRDVVPLQGIAGLRDLKITPFGTITYTIEDMAMAIDYQGNVLWRGPNKDTVNGDTSEHYHHQLDMMKNGHYMVLGYERVPFAIPGYHGLPSGEEDKFTKKDSSGNYIQYIEFGTVLEYDGKGKLLWRWDPSDYFRKTDLFGHYLPNGKLPQTDVHENAFFLDSKKNVLYIGFRNISRILKVKYPEGKVLAVYGIAAKTGTESLCNDLFCGQHCIGVTKEGDLYIYNNNSRSDSSVPRVIVLKEPDATNPFFEKVWEYECHVSGLDEYETNAQKDKKMELKAVGEIYDKKAMPFPMTPGGNVIEMPDGSFFVSTGGNVANIFIVNRNKEVAWSAIVEQQPTETLPWLTKSNYRASIIERADLEKLIRTAESNALRQ